MTSLSSLSVTELADGICLRAGRIAAAQAELLSWVAEFDRREGWTGTGLLSCAHWLSWRIGLSPSAAREQVRVARRLEELPAVAAAFADGRISYSKVRAITRAAEPDDGVDWVELARHSSGAQLEKIARGVRRAWANAAAALDPAAAAWSLRTRTRFDDNGNFVLTISGPAQYLPVLQAGIDAKRAELQRQRDAAEDEADVATPAPEQTADRAGPAGPAGASAEAPEVAPVQAGGASAEAPGVAPVQAGGASAEAPGVAPEEIRVTPPVQDGAYLDEQAEGWPTGTTRREVRRAMAELFVAHEGLADTQDELPDAPMLPTPAYGATPPVRLVAATAGGSGASGASAEAPAAAKVTDAEALLALARDALAAEHAAHPDIARRRRPQLTAQIDPLSGWARQIDGELLPPSSLPAVLNTLPGPLRLRPISTADLQRHDLGRTQREVSLALRELLGALDGERCRFPGCTRRKKLHAHHVLYWSQGGTTDLGNLVLVCSRHHTLIHTQGFTLVLHPDRRLDVHTADGVAILHHPAQPWGDPAALARGRGQLVSAETLPPDHCTDRMDLGYIVSVLLAQAS
jgi:hypothetical protein